MKSIGILIGKIMGALLIIGTAGGVLWKVFAYTDDVQDHNKEVEQTLDYLVRNDSLRCIESDTIMTTLRKLNTTVDGLGQDVRALRSSYLDDKAKTLTTEEFLKLMEDLGLTDRIKKNSENNTIEIASDK